MEPQQQPPQQTPSQPVPEPPQPTAEAYYNQNRKRSFLFSRVTVITSMIVLVVVLAVNVSVLTSQERTTTQSRASEQANSQNLPSLAAGCKYQQTKGGVTVVCLTVTPVKNAVPLNIELPKLPPQCTLQTTTFGNRIQCTDKNVPIPTVPVTLPSSCTTAGQPNTIQCKPNNKKPSFIPLPSLPQGCEYIKVQSKYFVRCTAQQIPERKGD